MQAVAKFIVPDWGDKVDSGRVVLFIMQTYRCYIRRAISVRGCMVYGANIWLGLGRFGQAA